VHRFGILRTMPADPAVVLQAAAPARPAPGGVGRVLVAGAVGRLGEALLNEVLARGGYREVVALGDPTAAMSLGVRGLSLADADTLPPLDDLLMAPTLAPDAPGARSFYGRDAAFTLLTPAAVDRVAAAAARAGARRAVLVHPLSAWQQLSRWHLGLVGEAELALARLPFESVTVLRPLAAGSGGAGSWLHRVAAVYLSLQLLMMPRSMPVLTSVQVARVAVDALRAPTPGVRVLGAAQIAEALAPPAA
jgi:hypothetical protein